MTLVLKVYEMFVVNLLEKNTPFLKRHCALSHPGSGWHSWGFKPRLLYSSLVLHQLIHNDSNQADGSIVLPLIEQFCWVLSRKLVLD